MFQMLRTLWREEDGQDLIEYTLLIAFLALAAAAMGGFGGKSIQGITSTSNSQLAVASRIAGS